MNRPRHRRGSFQVATAIGLVVALLAVGGLRAETVTLVPAQGSWKYDDSGTDLGTTWRGLLYDDSTWAYGAAQLGYGDGDEATSLSYGSDSNNKYPCYYFRHTFNEEDPAAYESLTLRVLRDDGCVVYLNGTEVARSNMPSGEILYGTWASSAIGGADESTWYEFAVDAGLLVTGSNAVAVEVHQANGTSSDVSFDLELLATPVPPPVPSVTLESPEDGSTVNATSVSFTCSAMDALGLVDATLYVGQPPQTVTFSGPAETEDAQITADQPGGNLGDAVSINVDGQSPHAHAVIRFPNLIGSGPGQVPPGASIASATLELDCTNPGNTVTLYRLIEGWVEGEVTWNERATGLPWADAGADGPSSHAGTALQADLSATGRRTVDLTPFVQEWSDGASNYGIVLLDGGSDGVDFDSSESADPPVLTVLYQTAWAPVETQPLSGTSDTAAFGPITLGDQQDYVWNCRVTNTSSEAGWAPADFSLTVDTHAPDVPVPVAPPDGATGVSTSPTLEATVSDPDGDALDVTFYGRDASGLEPFAIVALPDSQKYSLSYPDIFAAQTQWVADNAAASNIAFVTHEGDIVDNWDDTIQWGCADAAMSLLDTIVPYGVLPGNHDQPTTYYNQYFPYTRYEGEAWYGGHYGSTNDNNFELFSAGGEEFLVLHLEFCPGSDIIAWASSVLDAFPDRKAMITTHGYIDTSGNRSVHSCTDTSYIWDDLVVPHENVYFVLCGHVSGECTRTDVLGDRQVHQLLADYQSRPNGGNGWLRIMRFAPAEDRVYVETYSPWLDQYETDADSQFALDLPMRGFVVIGQDTAVPSGQNASVPWTGLAENTEYEWFVEVADPSGRTQWSPLWRFTVGGDAVPPVISDVAAVDVTDSTARITWTTDEPADSLVEYGTDTMYGSQASDPALVASHSIALSGLTAATMYHYRVTSKDGAANSSTSGDFTFTTLPANQPPVANADAYSVDEDNALTVPAPGVLGNDTDPDGDALTATVATGPANGSLSLAADGSFTYTPNPDYNGTDSFTYTAGDGKGGTDTAAVTITVNPVNDAPVANADAYSVDEDNALTVPAPGVLGNDTDPDGDALTATVATGPANGSLSLAADGSFTYTPNPDYNGTDSFTYTAGDGRGGTDTAAVTITVNPIDDLPAVPQNLTATAGSGSVSLDWDDNPDPEGDLVGYNVYRAESAAGYDFGQPLAAATQSAYLDEAVVNGTTYYYVVKAIDVAGQESDPSVEVSATPTAPGEDVYVTEDPIVTLGTLGGDGVGGTTAAGDGLAQTIKEGPDGKGGKASLEAEYRLHTTLDPADVTEFVLYLERTWTDLDGPDDPLVISIWNGTAWEDITADIEDGSFAVFSAAGSYIEADGTIRILFTDTAPIRKEGKDTLAIDLLYAHVAAGPPDTEPPAAPAGLVATGGDAVVDLDWADNAEPDLASYTVYRSQTSGGSYGKVAEGLTTSDYADWSVAIGTTYYYVVTATDASGNESGYSNEASGTPIDLPPAAPTGLAATGGDAVVDLDWADNAEPDLAGYTVYRSTEFRGSYTPIVSGRPTSDYADASVTNGTTYYYVVTAVDATGNESASSAEASATPSAQPTIHVANIDMALQKAGKNWSAVATVTIQDGYGAPQAGATVVGDWTFKGALIEAGATAVTDGFGNAELTSPRKKAKSGETFTFAVKDVTLAGYAYDPADNVETQDSISVP